MKKFYIYTVQSGADFKGGESRGHLGSPFWAFRIVWVKNLLINIGQRFLTFFYLSTPFGHA